MSAQRVFERAAWKRTRKESVDVDPVFGRRRTVEAFRPWLVRTAKAMPRFAADARLRSLLARWGISARPNAKGEIRI